MKIFTKIYFFTFRVFFHGVTSTGIFCFFGMLDLAQSEE